MFNVRGVTHRYWVIFVLSFVNHNYTKRLNITMNLLKLNDHTEKYLRKMFPFHLSFVKNYDIILVQYTYSDTILNQAGMLIYYSNYYTIF